ncbi:sodium/myo-inositol cotransporter 2 isoform X2 [Hippocampus zosterae]|uniref:sodium/myo-inositol cotransporter 2 isoform X2 n=1 Tax=Hippocampus zosterae TaxID=109293 RepID=UPI00223E1A51|nr:sodium/myo-inositol cotransporter 2 isoform X2 [Hippocampus zosterae]
MRTCNDHLFDTLATCALCARGAINLLQFNSCLSAHVLNVEFDLLLRETSSLIHSSSANSCSRLVVSGNPQREDLRSCSHSARKHHVYDTVYRRRRCCLCRRGRSGTGALFRLASGRGLLVNVEDEAQHSGWLLPGREEHDLVAGGLAAVIYTDAAQTVIMLGGALILMGFSFAKVGGWNALMEGYFDAIPSVRVPNTTCGIPREDSFHLFRDPVDSDLPWPGVFIGMSVPSMWYWCSDQVIVQRSLAAKTLSHAKGGSLLAAYLKVVPFFAIMLPGMISRILFTDDVACADPELCKQICGNPVGCTDTAYARLVMELLPAGLRGLMTAVMIAALVSSLTSVFNSASTIFTIDLWKTFRSGASEWELMIVGRVFVLILVVASILWIPVIQASQGGQLFIYIQSISTYLQPPVSIIFLLGCFWKRTNEKGAFWGMVVGLTIGCIRMLMDFIYPAPMCFEPDDRPVVVKSVHYLYFSMMLSFITLVVVVLVSLATDKPKDEQIDRLTWFTRLSPVKAKEQPREEVASHERAEMVVTEKEGDNSTRKDSSGKDSSMRRQSRLVSALYWLCGLNPQKKESKKSPVTPATSDLSQLKENPRLKQVLNANLIMCLSVAMFIIGYWA